MSLATTERLVETAIREMDAKTPAEIAVKVGVSTNGRAVRATIRAARESLQQNAERYVELHMLATEKAALDGDAGPAQWALERIAEKGDRIVDTPKSAGVMPSLQIGIQVGGVPPTHAITAEELPILEAAPIEDTDMP